MALHERVLAREPVATLDAYRAGGGGRALAAARRVAPATLIGEVAASGLRGRGGAGFPTAEKWRTVAANCSLEVPSTVVVNGAEGEPGSFKDRMILRTDPYRVLEGALVAARAVGADSVVFVMKRTFELELARVRAAVEEARAAGWCDDLAVDVFSGPAEYLFGEETALLEAVDGRPPFPRVTPPYRRGVDELVDGTVDVTDDSSSAANVQLAGPTGETVGPPTLVDNVETLANVPGIVAEGAEWFRSVGTTESPGTMVCTVSGRAPRHGVAEFAMGTPLREVLETIGDVDVGDVRAVLSGVSNRLLGVDDLGAPLSYEGLAAVGSGLGTAGFIVFDRWSDLAAVAAGVARFLAVESCGQCTPCKQDGLSIADQLTAIVAVDGAGGGGAEMTRVRSRLVTISDGARCNLASQQQAVVGSILDRFRDVRDHVTHELAPTAIEPIAAIVDIVDGRARLDDAQARKQPDWTFDEQDSGRSPADRLDDHRAVRETL